MKNFYQANPSQTIFDVALQFYGSIEGVRWLLEDNNDLITPDGLLDLSSPLKIRKGSLDNYVSTVYGSYIPVTEGIEEGGEYVIIDDNNDTPTDNNNDAPSASLL